MHSGSRGAQPEFQDDDLRRNSFIFDRSNDGFSETMGYYYLDYAERYIQSLGFTNINNRQQVFSVNRLKIDNSFYAPNIKDITYGLGGVEAKGLISSGQLNT